MSEPTGMRSAGGVVDSTEQLLAQHGAALTRLRGRSIEAVWVAWDAKADEWFPDEAVVVDFGSLRFEVVCWKLCEMSVTWQQIDLTRPPAFVSDWSGPGSSFRLEWRRGATPVARQVVGQTVRAVHAIEHRMTIQDDRSVDRFGPWMLNGLQLTLDHDRLTVFNALDENGLSLDPQEGPNLRRVAVAP